MIGNALAAGLFHDRHKMLLLVTIEHNSCVCMRKRSVWINRTCFDKVVWNRHALRINLKLLLALRSTDGDHLGLHHTSLLQNKSSLLVILSIAEIINGTENLPKVKFQHKLSMDSFCVFTLFIFVLLIYHLRKVGLTYLNSM